MTHRRVCWSLLCLLALILSSCRQVTPEVALEPQFGTVQNDSATQVAVQKAFGHVYVAGTSGDKAYVRQYRRSGTLNWEKRFSAPAGQFARVLGLGADGSGNVYLAWARFDTTDARFYDVPKSGPFVTKYNRGGTLLWRKSFPNLNDMAVDSAGNFYLVGASPNSVRKHTTAGTLVWEREADRVGDVYGLIHITVATSGSVVVVSTEGTMLKYDGNGNNGRVLPGIYFEGRNERVEDLALGPNEEIYLGVRANYLDSTARGPAIHAFSAEGGYRWGSLLVSADTTDIGVTTDALGNAYLTGNYACELGEWYDSESCPSGSPVGGDAFVRKFTPNGAITWTRRFGTSRPDTGAALATYSASELYAVGYTEGSLAGPNLGGTDAFLRRMDGLGNRVWTR